MPVGDLAASHGVPGVPGVGLVATLTLFPLRSALLIDQAREGGARRRIVRDRALEALAVLWVALFAAAAYL